MKKILSVLAICLVLVLACTGLAIAEDLDLLAGDTDFGGDTGETPTREHGLEIEEVDTLIKEEPATCEKNGIKIYQCSIDGSIFHEIIDYAPGHDLDKENYEVIREGSCLIPQIRRYHCTRCDYYEDEEVEVAHVWSSAVDGEKWGKIIDPPTCESEGTAIDFCTVCGVENGDVYRVIEPLEHVYSKCILDEIPHCDPAADDAVILPGVCHWVCEICDFDPDWYDYEMTLEEYKLWFDDPTYDGHKWDGKIIETEPTCTTPGLSVRFCIRCGEKQFNQEPVIPHQYEEKKTLLNCYEAEYRWICKVCGQLDPDFGTDGVQHEDVIAHQFEFTDDYIYEEKDPTCTEDGYIIYFCKHWDDMHPGNKYDALDEGALISIPVPAPGHTWGDWVERYPAGAGENEYGYYIRKCLVCGAHEEKVTRYDVEECAEGEHLFVPYEGNEDAEGSVEPTCTEWGWDAEICTICGYIERLPVEPLGHDYKEEIVTEPTCTEKGKKLLTCQRKGCEDPIKTEDIPATQHKPEKQDDGSVICTVCGEKLEEAPKNGFVVEDGVWKWYKDDVWQKDLTAIVTFDGAEFWVVNGVLPLDANGLINCPDGKFYFLSQGKIVRNTGFVEYLGQWFKIVNGELDLTYNGLCDYDGGKFLVAAGRWIQTVSGLWQNLDSKWYYLADGQVVAYSGVAEYNGRFFVVANGVLDTSYNGTIKYDGHTFEVVNGQLAEVPID